MSSTAGAATMRIRDVDLEIFERGSGPPLLFLHDELGLTPEAHYLDALAQHFRVIAPSHPGFGHSSLPDTFDSVDDLAFFYLDLLDALDLSNVVLAGASFGGWIAAEMAVRCCHRLQQLVLIDPIGIKNGDRETREIADFFSLPPARVAELAYYQPPAKPPAIDPRTLSDDELGAIARNRESFALFCWEPFAHNPKLRSRLHRVVVPTLVLWGESDGIVTPAYGGAFAGAIAGARFEIIPKAGHYPQREQPEAFVERLLAFAS